MKRENCPEIAGAHEKRDRREPIVGIIGKSVKINQGSANHGPTAL
jgi:hypothetical protein